MLNPLVFDAATLPRKLSVCRIQIHYTENCKECNVFSPQNVRKRDRLRIIVLCPFLCSELTFHHISKQVPHHGTCPILTPQSYLTLLFRHHKLPAGMNQIGIINQLTIQLHDVLHGTTALLRDNPKGIALLYHIDNILFILYGNCRCFLFRIRQERISVLRC